MAGNSNTIAAQAFVQTGVINNVRFSGATDISTMMYDYVRCSAETETVKSPLPTG